MNDEIEREIIVWLKDGKYRVKILKLLEKGPLLSSEIAGNLMTHRSSTSRVLNKLKGYGLIESVPSKSRTIEYNITEKGRKALKYFGD
ncbi:MAG: ArsR family transcriptional regulator [Candidatus Woesearchaeota archaeon]